MFIKNITTKSPITKNNLYKNMKCQQTKDQFHNDGVYTYIVPNNFGPFWGRGLGFTDFYQMLVCFYDQKVITFEKGFLKCQN